MFSGLNIGVTGMPFTFAKPQKAQVTWCFCMERESLLKRLGIPCFLSSRVFVELFALTFVVWAALIPSTLSIVQ